MIPGLLIAGVIFVAGLVSGMLSFGFALVAIPILSIFINPVDVVIVITLLYACNSLYILWKQHPHVERKYMSPLLVGGAVGIPLGIYLLKNTDPNNMKVVMGGVIMIFGIILYQGVSLPNDSRKRVMGSVGIFSGILAGGTGIMGTPVALFFKSQGMQKKDFRANLIAYLSVMTCSTIFIMSLQGMVTVQSLRQLLYLLPLMIIGVHFGDKIGERIHPDKFKKIVILLAILAGGVSILKGLGVI